MICRIVFQWIAKRFNIFPSKDWSEYEGPNGYWTKLNNFHEILFSSGLSLSVRRVLESNIVYIESEMSSRTLFSQKVLIVTSFFEHENFLSFHGRSGTHFGRENTCFYIHCRQGKLAAVFRGVLVLFSSNSNCSPNDCVEVPKKKTIRKPYRSLN